MIYRLGVDLGTTWTAAAVLRDGRASMVDLSTRSTAVPSVVLPREDGSMLVGEAADRRASVEPTRVAREFKRRIGDSTPLLLGGTPYSAESLTARLLGWVVDEVSQREGGPPERLALTHPANWGEYKLDLLRQAVLLADIDAPIELISEPEAAVIHYASQERVEPDTVIGVYDLGGGTFDAAVLRKTVAGFELLGRPEGIERLGGIDFDEAVFQRVVRSIGIDFTELDADDPHLEAALRRLRADCVVAKEMLSADSDTSIPVMLPSLQTEVRLTRTELESMIRPTLADTITVTQRAIDSTGIGVEGVDRILLIGGSSRIPVVSELLASAFGRPLAVDAHPKNAVALGAAIASGSQIQTATGATVTGANLPGTTPPGATSAGAGGAATTGSGMAAPEVWRPEAATPGVGVPGVAVPGVAVPGAGSFEQPPATPDVAAPAAGLFERPPTAPDVAATGPVGTGSVEPPPTAPAPASGGGAPTGGDRAWPESADTVAMPTQAAAQPEPFGLAADQSPGLAFAPAGSGARRRSGFPLILAGVAAIAVLAVLGLAALELFGNEDGTTSATGDLTDDTSADATTAPADGATTAPAETAPGDSATTAPAETTTTAPTTTLQEDGFLDGVRCEAVEGLCIDVTDVSLQNGELLISWDANFEPSVGNGNHAHFFWSTIAPAQAGAGGSGSWEVSDAQPHLAGTYGGAILAANRPAGADICVTVANPDHTVRDPAIYQCWEYPGS